MTPSRKDTEGHRDRLIWITASWIGAVLSLGMGFMVYEALPEARMFILSALGLVS